MGICALAALVVLYFFSGIMIILFAGQAIPEASGILIFVAIAVTFISLANLILLYKISIGNTRRYTLLFVFVAIEVALLSHFSNNLFEYAIAFIASSAAFLWGSVVLLEK